MSNNERCKKVLHHLNRIQGQIDGLKRAIEEQQDCEKVARLSTSIARSFKSVQASIVEEYILEEFGDNSMNAEKGQKLSEILSVFKS